MAAVLKHDRGEVHVEELPDGTRRVSVKPSSPGSFIPVAECVTDYPLVLIEGILQAIGPEYLCDEILREESAEYVEERKKMGSDTGRSVRPQCSLLAGTIENIAI